MLNRIKQPQRPYILKFFLWPIVFYLTFLGAYTAYLLFEMKETTLKEIDTRLIKAAYHIPTLLADDFHDRAVSAEAISYEEELTNRQRLNDFIRGGNFIYAYTLVQKDGKFYFTAPTVTEAEAAERKSWYFYPYEDAPPEFVLALQSGTTQFISYQDHWGSFRSVAVPLASPQGNRYLVCIDVRQDVVGRTVKKAQWVAVFTGVAFSLMIILFLLASLKAHKAVAIYSQAMTRENSRLRHDAEYDALTGILNNRTFFRVAQDLYDKCAEQQESGAILMLDCDRFKEINDQYGHLAGDKALAVLAEVYRRVFPAKTLVGRYGGDEFIAFVPGIASEMAEAIAREVIKAVQQEQVLVDGIVLPLSVSAGIVWFAERSLPFMELVKQADKALLDVKHTGNKPAYRLIYADQTDN